MVKVIILVGLFALALLMSSAGARPFPNGHGPPKIYREYPEITVTGFLTFNEWQAKFGGGSMLDYEDWLKGV